MACEDSPPSPWLLSDKRVGTGEDERLTMAVRPRWVGGVAGLHEFDCLIRLYFMVCQAK